MKIIKTILIAINAAIGRRYMANENSLEMHDIKNPHVNCHLTAIKKYRFLTRRRAMQMIDLGEYNGCRWCMKEHDTDGKN